MRTKTYDNGAAPTEVCDNGTAHAKTSRNGAVRTKTGDNGAAPTEVCDNGTVHAKTGDNGKSPPEGGLLPDRDTPPTAGRGKLLFAVGMP